MTDVDGVVDLMVTGSVVASALVSLGFVCYRTVTRLPYVILGREGTFWSRWDDYVDSLHLRESALFMGVVMVGAAAYFQNYMHALVVAGLLAIAAWWTR